MADREFIKKITSRTVGTEKSVGESFVIMGKIMRAKANENQYGPYTTFGGQFLAVNEKTAKEYSSAAFIPPGISEDLLMSALQSAQEKDTNASVEFAMRYRTKADDKSAIGYVWACEFLQKPSADDPTERLMSSLKDKLKLAPPEKAKA